jgi:uncharacterized membrane protein YesL
LLEFYKAIFFSVLLFVSASIGLWYVIKYNWHFKPPVSPRWKIYLYVPLAIVLPIIFGIGVLLSVI